MKKKFPLFLLWAFVVVAFIGFLDATYLTVTHYTGGLECNIIHGCDEVLSSKYSELFGIPISIFGAGYYLTVIFLCLLYLDLKKGGLMKLVFGLTVVGLGVTAWMVYLMAFVIEAWCQYCLLSALTSTTLFVLSMVSLKYRERLAAE